MKYIKPIFENKKEKIEKIREVIEDALIYEFIKINDFIITDRIVFDNVIEFLISNSDIEDCEVGFDGFDIDGVRRDYTGQMENFIKYGQLVEKFTKGIHSILRHIKKTDLVVHNYQMSINCTDGWNYNQFVIRFLI